VTASCFTVSASDGVPALNITAPNGKTSIILGSLHVGIHGLNEPDRSLFKNIKRYVVEHRSQSSDLQRSGKLNSKERAEWTKELTARELDIYYQRAICGGKSKAEAEVYLTYPSVQTANQFTYTICGQNSISRDYYLLLSRPINVPIEVLEEEEWIESQRRKVPSNLANRAFRWSLEHDPMEVLGGIRDALNQGDYASLYTQVVASLGNEEYAEEYIRIMVDERNHAWMPKLKNYLNDGGALVVVGAMHLSGKNGLIKLLRKSGYEVSTTVLPGIKRIN
jgi:uncharacterized protein YbaP (TraB family)